MGYTKSEETKEKLVSATSKLLRTRGYGATGISQILQESGVPKGSLYHHFPDGKTELAAEAVSFSNQFIAERIELLISHSSDAASAFEAFCNFYGDSLQSTDFQKGCPIATITLEVASSVPDIQHRCEEGFAMITDIFERELISEGAEPDKAKSLTMLALSAIEGALVLCRANRSTQPLLSIKKSIAEQMRSITAPRVDT